MQKRKDEETETKNIDGSELWLDEIILYKRSNSFPDDEDDSTPSTDEEEEE